MKFVCDRCQTKYSIADDKVRGKVLKVRCKTCQNVITVREAGARPSVASLAPVRPSQKPSQGPLATLGETPEEPAERTSIAPAPAGLMADMLSNQRRATPPPPPPLGDGIEWFLALDGAQQGPFTRKLLVDRVLALPKTADVHVWNDKMDGWKPPGDVPEIAHDLAARKPPAVPVRPPVPRTTPSPPVPPLAAARRGTQPVATGVAAKLPLPAPHVAAAAHAVPAPHATPDAADATPPPLAAHGHMPGATNGAAKTNGVAGHASSPDVDALSALNLGGAVAKATAAPPPRSSPPRSSPPRSSPPRIMEVGEATAWSGAGRVQEGRHGSTKMIFGLLGVFSIIIVVFALNMKQKAPAVVSAASAKAGLDSEALGKLGDLAAQQKNDPLPPPTPAPSEVAQDEQAHTKGTRGRPAMRGRPLPPRSGTNPGAFTGTTPATPPGTAPAPAVDPNAARFGQAERRVTPSAAIASRPPPSQGEITRVIANNKIGIKTCYQRALLRDSSLTHGKIVVGVTIGISGRVKGVHVDGPSSFRSLEPCIKEMVGRWTFPQASEEYGTEFSYLFQGNE